MLETQIKNIILMNTADKNRALEYINFLEENESFKEDGIERHHILPKSLYPNYQKEKTNLIKLTPYNHFLTHKYLADIFPSYEMSLALHFMALSFKDSLSEEEYNKIKQKHREAISKALMGKPKTEEHKKHISESRKGLSYGPLTEEHKQKISNSLKGKGPSELNRKINSKRCKNRKGENNPNSKKIICVEDNLIFNTVKECSEYYHISNLYRYTTTGKIHKKLNKHFKYFEEN